MSGQSLITKDHIARANHSSKWLSAFSLRFTGYTLLILTLFNTVATIFPPQLMDPNWELNTISTLVGQAPIPLIGFALVFYRGLQYRRRLEKVWLRPLAFLAILIGIIFILMIPLGVVNSIRIDKTDQGDNAQQLTQQLARFQQLEAQVENTSATDVAEVAQRFQLQLPSTTNQDPDAIKAEVLAQLKANQDSVKSEAQSTRARQQTQHIKATVKSMLGALLSGTCFIYLGYIVQKIYVLSSQ